MSLRIERIDWDGADAPALAARVRALAPSLEDVSEPVRDILSRVRRQGDAAVRELTTRFGELAPERLRIDPQTLAGASGLLEPPVREALRVATRSIAAVARAEVEAGARPAVATGEQGQAVEVRREPVGAAGIYAPGGSAALASTVLMCCVPARLAGVGRIVVVTGEGVEVSEDACRPREVLLHHGAPRHDLAVHPLRAAKLHKRPGEQRHARYVQ